MTPAAELVVVALGSNLGDSKAIVKRAMEALTQFSKKPLLRSSFWRTEPVDCPPGSPPFINAVVAFEPMEGETPESLLQKLQRMEKEFGRPPKTVLNEARPLDLDLIAFGRETRNSGELVLPHPRAFARRFVLEPLKEILPGYRLPGSAEPVEALLLRSPNQPEVERLLEPNA